MRDALIEFIRLAGRTRLSADEIASELSKLAGLGVDWPKASKRQWLAEIEGSIADKALSMDEGGFVRLPKVQESEVQLLLF